MQSIDTAFLGTFVHVPERGALEVLADTLVTVGPDGRILEILGPSDASRAARVAEARSAGTLHEAGTDELFIPGLVDLHVHAPQWPQLGLALHLPLERWLTEVTFPLEARYADAGFAARSHASLVDALLAEGTTTAVYFGSAHLEATAILAAECVRQGQRALVGKVIMDHPDACPEDYRDEDVQGAIAATRELESHVTTLAGNEDGRVRTLVTPRFIPACTDEALAASGKLAADLDLAVQSHCSESDWEHGHVKARTGRTDARALDDFGLLRPGSVLAHCNFLEPTDRALLADRRVGVAHCPHSNAYFADSVFPLREALDEGVPVGLGTDIAGGPSASLFDAMRAAVASSRILEHGSDPTLPPDTRGRAPARVDWLDAFWLGTAAGADVVGLDTGRFRPGAHFDALSVDTATLGPGSLLGDDAEDALQRIVYLAESRHITGVWTDGTRRRGPASGGFTRVR